MVRPRGSSVGKTRPDVEFVVFELRQISGAPGGTAHCLWSERKPLQLSHGANLPMRDATERPINPGVGRH
jgi:hypothetical protein